MKQSLFSLLVSAFKQWNKQRSVRYTHWDIKALAREIDPEKWAAFDAAPEFNAPGQKKYYADTQFGLSKSMKIASRLLSAGWTNNTRPMLWNDEQLNELVVKSKNHNATN